MNARSALQLSLFGLSVFLFYKFVWPSLTKEAAVVGLLAGSFVHWALTNKGNKNVIYFKPFSAGWRVFFYDIMLFMALFTLYQATTSLAAMLEALTTLNDIVLSIVVLVVGIVVDYFVRG